MLASQSTGDFAASAMGQWQPCVGVLGVQPIVKQIMMASWRLSTRLEWGRSGSYSIRITGNVGATPFPVRMGKEGRGEFDPKKD